MTSEAQAIFELGKSHELGERNTLDLFKAVQYYKSAINQGHALAANRLGSIYKKGYGGQERDLKLAMKYWKLAAKRGNIEAMANLAWTNVEEGEIEEGKKWFTKAVDAGHEESKNRANEFEQTCKLIEDQLKEFRTNFQIGGGDFSLKELQKEIDKIIPGFGQHTQPKHFPRHPREAIPPVLNHSSVVSLPIKCYQQFDLIKNWSLGADYKEKEHGYGKRLYEAMMGFIFARQLLCTYQEKKQEMTDGVRLCKEVMIVHTFAQSLRTTEVVATFSPREIYELKDIIERIERNAATTNNSETLKNLADPMDINCDVGILKSYVILTSSPISNFVQFLRECIEKHPQEYYFHRAICDFLRQEGNGLEGAKLAGDYLKKFQHHPYAYELLYSRASNVLWTWNEEHENTTKTKFTKETWLKFLNHPKLPKDHRMIPEAYYTLSYLSFACGRRGGVQGHVIGSESLKYYHKGVESEKHLLPVFLPYEEESPYKKMLMAVIEKKETPPPQMNNPSSSTAATASGKVLKNPQLVNPNRIETILEHRKNIQQLLSQSGVKNQNQNASSATTNATPPFDPKESRDLRFHSAKLELQPSTANYVLNKTSSTSCLHMIITEGPIFQPGRGTGTVKFLVQDENEKTLSFEVYGLLRCFNMIPEDEVRERTRVGKKMILKETAVLEKQAAVTIVKAVLTFVGNIADEHEQEGQERKEENDLCRFCLKPDAPKTCGKCKRAKYCDQECQLNDWKILKHKLICEAEATKWENVQFSRQ